MALTDDWSTAWRTRYGLPAGWVVNLEPTRGAALGEVGVLRGTNLAHETTLDDRGVTGLPVQPDQRRDDTGWQFVSNQDISVSLSSKGQTAEAVSAAGSAGWTLGLSFGSSSGAASYGTAMWWSGYSDLGLVRAGIVEAAKGGRLHKGESVVVEQQLTGKGVLFVSEGSNGSLNAEADGAAGPGATPSIASLSGSLNVSHSSGAAAMKSYADGSVLAYRVLTLGLRGFFWAREFVALGVLPTDPDELEEVTLNPVEGDGPDDYFALV